MSSPFLKLPPELRISIYELVAANDGPSVNIKHGGLAATLSDPDPWHKNAGLHAGLARVCSQVRKECLSVQQAGARVSVRSSQLNEFMDTFLDGVVVLKELEIRFSWTENHPIIDLQPIMRGRARSSDRTTCLVTNDPIQGKHDRDFLHSERFSYKGLCYGRSCERDLELILSAEGEAWLSMFRGSSSRLHGCCFNPHGLSSRRHKTSLDLLRPNLGTLTLRHDLGDVNVMPRNESSSYGMGDLEDEELKSAVHYIAARLREKPADPAPQNLAHAPIG